MTRMQRFTARYYQLLQGVQLKWTRFRASEVGAAFVCLLRWSWLYFKWSMLFIVALIVVMYGLMLFLFLVCTGNGKAAINSFTKIILVVVGLFTAKHLIKHKAEVAAAIKAVAK